jgi:hypothetical protein
MSSSYRVDSCHLPVQWKAYSGMSDKEEEDFKTLSPSGKVPVGVSDIAPLESCWLLSHQWYYGRPSERSAPLVAKVYRELGHELLYWADTYADDLPYWTNKPGGQKDEGLVMMPYTLDCVSLRSHFSSYGY